MVVQLSINPIGLNHLLRDYSDLEKKFIPAATVRTHNRIANSVRSYASKSVAKKMGTTQKVVRGRVKVRKATRQYLNSMIWADGTAMGLIHFSAKQLKRGVSSRAWGKRKVYKGAFIAKAKGSGSKQVFARKGSARLPIKKLFGPSIPKTMAEKELQKGYAALIDSRWPQEFNRDLAWRVSKFKSSKLKL